MNIFYHAIAPGDSDAGITPICEKCGVEVVSAEDLYEDRGLQVCEDCKIKSTSSPSQSCGGEV